MLASLGVFLRDVGQTIGIITTVMMFLSPVFYPVTALPEEFRPFIMANPLTFIIEQAREVLIWGHLPNWIGFGYLHLGRHRRGLGRLRLVPKNQKGVCRCPLSPLTTHHSPLTRHQPTSSGTTPLLLVHAAKRKTAIVVQSSGLPDCPDRANLRWHMRLKESLYQHGCRTFVLDGDNVRHGLCGDLGFSAKDRQENIRRIGEVAKLFMEAGVIVLTAFISPYRADRERVRDMVEHGDFIEIYCDASIEVCEIA